jgi:hypothetical protein
VRPASAAATVKAVETRREAPARPAAAATAAAVQPVAAGQLKEAFLEEVRKGKKFFHGTVVAMAQKIEHDGDTIVFTFGPHHKALRLQLDQKRTELEEVASRLAGRRITILSAEGLPTPPSGKPGAGPNRAAPDERKTELTQQALEDSGVQAMLDVFAAEIKDVEER